MSIDHLSQTPEPELQRLQREVGRWSEETFGDNEHNLSKVTGLPQGSQNALTGLVEEVGELNHVHICSHQGRRGYDDEVKRRADKEDAVADIMIFLLDYCYREQINLSKTVNQTWEKIVSQRDLENWEQLSHTTTYPSKELKEVSDSEAVVTYDSSDPHRVASERAAERFEAANRELEVENVDVTSLWDEVPKVLVDERRQRAEDDGPNYDEGGEG